jgi:hypothetical protein
LNATISNNRIISLNNTGDNGIPFDIRGTVFGDINILNNSIENVDDEAIDLELRNTPNNSNPGIVRFSISNNINISNPAELLAISIVRDTGSPVSTYYVLGPDASNATLSRETNYGAGNYPTIYINGVLR